MPSYTKLADEQFQKSYEWRNKYFAPILKLLTRAKITANQITFFRLIFIAPIVYFMFYNFSLLWAGIFYVIFWLLDLFDGALARYQNTASDRGKFLDVFVDVFVFSIFFLSLINFNFVAPIILAYLVLIHATLYLLAIIYKYEGRQTDWIIQPKPDLTYIKFTIHAILIVGLILYLPILDWGFTILNIYMSVLALYYFYKIYQKKTWRV